jgi:hypothetical protein
LFPSKRVLSISNFENAWNNVSTSKAQAPVKIGPFYEEEDDRGHYGEESSSGKRAKSTHPDVDRGMNLFGKQVDISGVGPRSTTNGAGNELEDWEKPRETPLPSFSGLSFGNSRPAT